MIKTIIKIFNFTTVLTLFLFLPKDGCSDIFANLSFISTWDEVLTLYTCDELNTLDVTFNELSDKEKASIVSSYMHKNNNACYSVEKSIQRLKALGENNGPLSQYYMYTFIDSILKGIESGSIALPGEGIFPYTRRDAIDYLEKSANSGRSEAQFELGKLYMTGNGVRKNYNKGVTLLQNAAFSDHFGANEMLLYIYLDSTLILKNDLYAYFWALDTHFLYENPNNFRFLDDSEKYKRLFEIKIKELEAKIGINNSLLVQRLLAENPAKDAHIKLTEYINNNSEILREPRAQVSVGTGFFVNEDSVITCSHVVQGKRNISVLVNGKEIKAEITNVDILNDLALLKIPNFKSKFLHLCKTDIVNVGQEVVLIGYPLPNVLGNSLKLATGSISSIGGPKGDSRILQIGAAVQKGNSGGPLFDVKGNVVGVIFAKLDAIKAAKDTGDIPQNVSFALNISMLKQFLSLSNEKFYIDNPWFSYSAEQIFENNKEAIVMVISQ